MARAEFLSLGDEFQVERITYTSTALLVEMVSRASRVCCPPCRHMTLAVTVRKFFCQNPTCPHHIFAERFPEFAQSCARRTNRLLTVLRALGLVAGGETGARLAAKLGIQTSASTILRCHTPRPVGNVEICSQRHTNARC